MNIWRGHLSFNCSSRFGATDRFGTSVFAPTVNVFREGRPQALVPPLSHDTYIHTYKHVTQNCKFEVIIVKKIPDHFFMTPFS